MFTFLEHLIDAKTPEQVSGCYFREMARIGFGSVFYAARFQLRVPETVLSEKPFIASNFPREFVETVRREGLFAASHWTNWMLSASTSDIAATKLAHPSIRAELTEPGQRAFDLIAQHGLAHAHLVNLRDKVSRAHGGVALLPYPGAGPRETARLWQARGRFATILAWVTHMRMSTIPQRHNPCILTCRQREVLEWSSAGKTVAEIATILGLTKPTVEKHLRLAREAMDANNTAHAVLKAHLTEQIFAPFMPSATTVSHP